jgi:hypothetical protein
VTVNRVISLLLDAGLNFANVDAAHSLGHLTRDYINSLRLFSKLDAPPSDLFLGFVGGCFHDLGCALVPRYDEQKRVIRHAEAGAILLEAVFEHDGIGLSREEQLLSEYGVAAHTNYLTTTKVTCSDGVVRTSNPYSNVDLHGNPVYSIIFPRWVDRLDCNGPTFVGRHYLGLTEQHEDFSGNRFQVITYANHMRPLLRAGDPNTSPDGGPTMLEHLQYFASGQASSSPHACYDFGEMIPLRDRQTRRLQRIIHAVLNPAPTALDEEKVSESWTTFLGSNIEPSPVGGEAANLLNARFHQLDHKSQTAWSYGFIETMKEYCLWAAEVNGALSALPNKWLNLPSVDDLVTVIQPNPKWYNSLHFTSG